MSKSDYRRPADYQINDVYQCDRCRREVEQVSVYGVGQCSCGGNLQKVGESYPASAEDWDEERDATNSECHRRQ